MSSTPPELKNDLIAKFKAGANLFVVVTAAMGKEVAQEYRDAPKAADAK